MNRWMLAMLMGAIALTPTIESARANTDVMLSQAEPSAEPAAPEADVLAQTWAEIRQARQATSAEQATEHLIQAAEFATRVQDLTRRQQFWTLIAIEYAALGNFEQAIALSNQLGYDVHAPEYCCLPLRTEAEMAIAKEYANAGRVDDAIQFATGIEIELQRNQVLVALIEQLAKNGEMDRAIALVAEITNDEFEVVHAQHGIIRGYITNQQFVDGLVFSQTMANVDERSGAQFNLVQGAIRAGEYATARQITQQISSPWTQQEALRITALAYNSIGDTAVARELVDQGYALLNTPDNQSLAHWLRNYAEIGAYDEAIRLAEERPTRWDEAESYIFIGEVLTKHGQWNEAFALAQRVQDGELHVLVDYGDPKIGLLNMIVREAAIAGQYDFAVQVARSFTRPEHRVEALLVVADQAQQTGNTPQAVSILWEAFELTKTIEQVGYHVDRHMYVQTSNAPLLTRLAEKFTNVGETERAIAALDIAVESAQAFEYDSYYDVLNSQFLEWQKIAQGYTELQQLDKAQSVLEIMTDLTNTREDLGIRTQELAEIGRMYGEINQPEQAQMLLDQALQASTQLEEGQSKLWAISAVVRGYAALGDNQKAEAIATQILQAAQAIEEPYQRNTVLGQIALALSTSSDPAMAIQLANAITDDAIRAQIFADLAARYLEAEQPRLAKRVAEQLVDTVNRMWDPVQRDSVLSNLIYNRYAVPWMTVPSWHYELALYLNDAIQDPKTRASNQFTIAQGYARNGDMEQAQASMERGLEAAAAISDRALHQETLWTSLDAILQAGQLELAAMLVQGFEAPKTRIVILRQLAQSYKQKGDMTRASALLDQARTEAEAIADLPSRMQILNSIDNQQSTWMLSLNYSIPL